MKSNNDIDCSQHALTTINCEMKSSRVGLTLGSHGMIEIYHYSRVEKFSQSYEWLERVAMDEPYRSPELRLIGKGRHVIEVLIMELLAATISVSFY